MFWIDFPTLVVIILAAMFLGIAGCVGFETAGSFLYGFDRQLAIAVGLCGLWQAMRQRFV